MSKGDTGNEHYGVRFDSPSTEDNRIPSTGKPKRTRHRPVYRNRARLPNGKLAPPPKVTSRKNGTPARFYVNHGTGSKYILDAPLDGRSVLGKHLKENLAELRSHLGSDITVPQDKLINQASRLDLLTDLCWAELMKAKGIVKGDQLHPAFEGFLKAVRQQQMILTLLGLKRPARKVSLTEYLAETGKGEVWSASSSHDEAAVMEDHDR